MTFRTQYLSSITLECNNPSCGQGIEYEWERPGPEKPTWDDIPDKLTLTCSACGVTGEYRPKLTRHGKALPPH